MRIKLSKLRKLISEALLREAKCPSCGSADAYVGFSSIECPNKRCMHYSPTQAAQTTVSAKTTSGRKATAVLLALADRITAADPSANSDDMPYVNDDGDPREIDDLFSDVTDADGLLPDGKLYNPFITDNAGPMLATDVDDKMIIIPDGDKLVAIPADELDDFDQIEDLYDYLGIGIHPSYRQNP